jgi:hypothetical protein
MRILLAVLMGAISGFLIYMMMAALLPYVPNVAASTMGALVIVTFIGGWAVSTWLLLRGAAGPSAVLRRGFLLGAAEWLTMALVGVVFAGKTASSTIDAAGGSDAANAGAAIGGFLFAAMAAGGVSVFMAVVCLIGFAIAYFTGREMKATTSTPTRKCPECAEMVQPDARKCRSCGADLTVVSSLPTQP